MLDFAPLRKTSNLPQYSSSFANMSSSPQPLGTLNACVAIGFIIWIQALEMCAACQLKRPVRNSCIRYNTAKSNGAFVGVNPEIEQNRVLRTIISITAAVLR